MRVVGDIETNIPYMPFIDSLEENTIQGNAYVSTIGTGTSNTEFEFLTGNPWPSCRRAAMPISSM